MNELAEQYFSEVYELGLRAADAIAEKARKMSSSVAAYKVGELVNQEAEYIAGYLNDVAADIHDVLYRDNYRDEDEVRAAVGDAMDKRYWRIGLYALALHSIAHRSFKDELIAQSPAVKASGFRLVALFSAFPEADIILTSCDGCMEAVGGNPYTPDNVPSPGMMECGTRCRHDILILKEAIASGETPDEY